MTPTQSQTTDLTPAWTSKGLRSLNSSWGVSLPDSGVDPSDLSLLHWPFQWAAAENAQSLACGVQASTKLDLT